MKFNGKQSKITHCAKAIKLLLLDVDGILTSGQLYYSANGEELKVFNSLDGHGIKLLQQSGIEVGIVSGRKSAALIERAENLKINILYLGREDKVTVVKEILKNHDLSSSEIAFAGDDLPDLPVVLLAGLGITVPNAHAELRKAAQIETEALGGAGAVREICDFLLLAQGHYENIIATYQNET